MRCRKCKMFKSDSTSEYLCMECVYRNEIAQLEKENKRLKEEITTARKELWMPDEEDETFLQGVEGVHFRIIGLLNEVKNLEYRVRELERTPPPATPA